MLGSVLVSLVLLYFLTPAITRWIFDSSLFPRPVRMIAGDVHDLSTASSKNKSMDLFGKVTDQNGDPVAGADVWLQYAQFTAGAMLGGDPSAAHDLRTTTGTDGGFSIHMQGTHLQLMGITKAGYEFKNYPQSVIQWYFDGSTPLPPTCDAAHPLVFVMWKSNGKPEPLWSINVTRKMEYGKTYSFFLYPSPWSTSGRDILEGRDPEADLWITQMRGPDKTTQNPGQIIYDWSFEVETPHGGLVHIDTAFPYLAPEAGYQSKLSYAVNTVGYAWGKVPDTRFYVKSRDGNLIGYVIVELGEYVGIKGLVNPSGSRNLQPGGGFLNH